MPKLNQPLSNSNFTKCWITSEVFLNAKCLNKIKPPSLRPGFLINSMAANPSYTVKSSNYYREIVDKVSGNQIYKIIKQKKVLENSKCFY